MDAGHPLQRLASRYGIDVGHWDWQGRRQAVSDRSLQAVLAAFGVDAGTDAACADALAALDRADAERLLPSCVVVRRGRRGDVDLGGSDAASDARVELEDGGRAPASVRGRRVRVPADVPLGYHQLVVEIAGAEHRTQLIVVPKRIRWPRALRMPTWGLAAQLYSVRSASSWGAGDLADLTALATWSAKAHRADFVLVNPLHAAEVTAPVNPSPYLPTSRRFGNPAYLRIEDIPEAAGVPLAELAARARAGAGELIDRDAVWAAQRAALELVHAAGRGAGRAAEFAAFVAREGEALDRFATWCAWSEVHGNDWRTWPAELRDPTTAAAADPARVEFYRWLQWVLADQLVGVQQAARAAGMRLGVVHDLAVGVSPGGADAWSYQDALASGVTVGAPPDDYSQLGQDWDQPPWRPDRLAELGYAPLRDLFRACLRHAGGLRIDHIIGLFRLWWIPAGQPAAAGAYVRYDHEAIIGILALEAERAGAVIIGEDLGNVEPWVHGYLHERGILGTSILWFESAGKGTPLPAEKWRRDCLASVTTHDLPPTVGYLAGEHVRLRAELGLLTRPLVEEEAADDAAKSRWLEALVAAGLLDRPAADDPHEVVLALHRFLARTPARLRCVALTDLVGERRTQNQPGTLDEYPNWRIPLGGPDGRPILLDDVIATDLGADVLAAVRSRPD
jgi:4-alpha-glucanotransferase